MTPSLWLMPIPFGIILGLAFLGVRATRWKVAEHALLYLFVVANLLTVLIFFFSSRYRLPAVPVAVSG